MFIIPSPGAELPVGKAGMDLDDKARAASEGMLYDFFVKEQSGILLGGNASSQQVFDFSGMPFKDQGTPEKPYPG